MTDNMHENLSNEIPDSREDLLETGDETLKQQLCGAYDRMEPTEEQQQRMLANLLQAQKARQAESDAATTATTATAATPTAATTGAATTAATAGAVTASETANMAATPTVPAADATASPRRTGGFRAWKAAVPLAACLVVGAILVGVSASQQPSAAPASSSSASVVATTTVKSEAAASSGRSAAAAAAGPEAVDMKASEAESNTDGYFYQYTDDYSETFNTEEYNSVDERGFISTKTSPLSTVSADVDTASYANLRRMINSGYTLGNLPTGAVRIEEMLNYFDYDYATPKGKNLFSMQAQASTCPWNDDTQLLVLGFATAPESQAASKGSNLVFLVDVSGSMNSPDKLDLLQDAFATFTERLGSNDRVSIVTYASSEEIVLEGASGDDKQAIMRAIYKLHAGGSTNGQAGLAQAYEVAERNYIEGGVNRIVMASDGDLNVGITSTSDLHDYVDKKRESGIYLSVLGFGSGNYKDTKMETLADHGNGSYHYIDSIEEAERVLVDKLEANLVPFADNVKIQVEFNPEQVKAYRLIGYENRALANEDFRNDAVDAGDVGPSSQFSVAYEVVLADSAMDIPESDLKYGSSKSEYGNNGNDWLTCTMRYHAFDGDEMREQELVVDKKSAAKTTDDWTFAAAVIEFGMIARDSSYAGTSSIDSVLALLDSIDLDDQRKSFKKLVLQAS